MHRNILLNYLKRSILIVLLFILFIPGGSAQTALWKNRLNGAGDNSDRYNGAITDAFGNFYLTGYTINPKTGKDFLTVKLNAAGDTLWTRKYNSLSNLDDEANFIAMDAAGNITITGYSDGGTASTKNDILTMQYNPSGALLWVSRYNYTLANEDEFPAAISIDNSNNIFISGRSDHSAANIDDMITIKYNASGVQQWVKRFDGGFTDRAAGVVADNTGGCTITGRTDNGVNDDIITISYSNTGTTNWSVTFAGPGGDDRGQAIGRDALGNIYVGGIRNNASDDDYVTIKYNSSGIQQWARVFDGGDNDRITTLKLDAAANIYASGQSDIIGGGSINYDFRTIKYNSAGIVQWNTVKGNPVLQEDVPSDIFIDGAGNVYVAGKSDASAGANLNYEFMTVKYNALGAQQWIKYYDGTIANAEDIPSAVLTDAAGNVWISGGVNFTATQKDATFIKYNSSGVFQTSKTFNGSGDFTDKANAIAVDGSNNLYITGYTLSAGAQRDIFVQKVNSAGTTLWSQTFNGTNENDEGLAIATDITGNIYVAGYSNGIGTYDDCILLKYNTSGVLQWSALYNYAANQIDKLVSIAVSNTGDIYVTGYSDSDNNPLITNYDYITMKYNAMGLQQWVTRFNGTGNGNDKPNKLVLSGNKIFVTGESFNGLNNDIVTLKYDNNGTLLGQVVFAGAGAGDDAGEDMFSIGSSIYITGSEFVTGNSDDYVTIKYDTTLTQIWKKNYNGTGDAIDRAYSISATASDVYVTGSSAGATSLNDIALIRYKASTGAQNWAKRYTSGASFNEEGYSVVTDASGNIYTAGKTGNAGNISDFIALNYNTAGAKLLTLKYNGTGNGEDVGVQAILDNNGYLYVTGYSEGTGNSNFDFTTIKYCTPLPEANITATGSTTICIGDSLALNANTGVDLTYQWKKGNPNIVGATSPIYYAKTTGSYKVVVTNTNGCTKTSNIISVTAIPCKENGLPEIQSYVEIMPNPFNEFAEVHLLNMTEATTINIFDITGKKVLTDVIPLGNDTYNFGFDFIPGIYTVILSTDTFIETVKIVKVN